METIACRALAQPVKLGRGLGTHDMVGQTG